MVLGIKECLVERATMHCIAMCVKSEVILNANFQVCIKFGVLDHFIGEKRVYKTKFNTNLTVQVVYSNSKEGILGIALEK